MSFFWQKQREKQPVVLIILDGWGEAANWGGNPISIAQTPTLNQLYRTSFHVALEASGAAVGLPGHEQGNSEVGHLTIGAGQPVVQDRTRISSAIDDGSFFQNAVLKQTMEQAKTTNHVLHLIGLVSPGGVHSHSDHLRALLEMAHKLAIPKVIIHAITDGRDMPPQAALKSIDEVRHWCTELGVGTIGSVVGRYYAMDRDSHWDRIEAAYNLITAGVGVHVPSALSAVSQAYTAGLSDEYVEPSVIDGSFAPIADGDSVVFFNFRQDRSRQLLTALSDPTFTDFKRPLKSNLFVATMIPYWFDIEHPGVHVVFPPAQLTDTLGHSLAMADMVQLRIAETEKYAHVTYFLNGGTEAPNTGEERVLIQSTVGRSAAANPAMQTLAIGQKLIHALKSGKYDCLIANIAAPDMVGHTGNFGATVTACEVVDQMLGQVVTVCAKESALLIITADHGNAEQLISPITNEPDTHHTTNLVPFIMMDPTNQWQGVSRPEQTLADVAPTVLTLLGVPVPLSMTGHSLVTMNSSTTGAKT